MVDRRSRNTVALCLMLGPWVVCSHDAKAQAPAGLHSVRANQVDLHYLAQGKGESVVFVHGGLVDYRRWADQVGPFSGKYRVITYSRRYNYPNRNRRVDPAYSAAVDADDLAALIQKLHLGSVHVIAESYGAYGALFLALHHPELVRTLVLAEPPVMPWLSASPEGRAAAEEFQSHLWRPLRAAFRTGDRATVMNLVAGYFLDGARADAFPPAVREQVEANLGEWRALRASNNAFPPLRREDVAGLQVPTLLLEGDGTLPLSRIVDAELVTLLPHSRKVIIAHASHEMWDEQPVACREKTLQFLEEAPATAVGLPRPPLEGP